MMDPYVWVWFLAGDAVSNCKLFGSLKRRPDEEQRALKRQSISSQFWEFGDFL